MINRFLKWLPTPLQQHDDCYIKCATCGHEVEHISNLKFIYVGKNRVEGLCPKCYGGTIYYKKDYNNLKAKPIPLNFDVIFKGEEYKL